MATENLTGFRLSPQQEHLWRLTQRDAGAYRAVCAVRLAGDLDPAALAAALDDVVRRHEILRTVLRRVPGLALPLQVVLDDVPPVRLGAAPEAAPGSSDAWDRPPLRAWLASAADTADAAAAAPDTVGRRLVLDLPAWCADAAGLENLVREVAQAYAARRGVPAVRDEPIQYADVGEILHEFLAEDGPAGGRAWWRGLGLDDPGLPFLRPPHNAAFAPSHLARAVPPALATDGGLGAPEDDPAAWLACWQILLWRLAERRPVPVGVAADGRTYEGLDEALGLFARHLPVLSPPAGDLPFRAFAARVREDLRAAAGRQEYFTWEDLEGVGYARCAFAVEPRLGVHRAAGLELAVAERTAVWDRFALKLTLVPGAPGPVLDLAFDPAAIPREEAARLLERFLTLAAAAVARPEAPLDDLPLVGPEERALLLAAGTAPAVLGPPRTLAGLWHERVRRDPDGTAAEFRGETLTCRDLAARAGRLAGRLRALGVGPEVRVALAVERSLDLVAGLLGILEAGGAYVPLDPAYPHDRLAFMLEDSRARVLVTQERLRGALPAPEGGVLCIDGGAGETGDTGGGDEPGPPAAGQDATPENLAYLIYTSGSTGRPKGVMVTHGAIVNRLLWMQSAFPLAADDAVLQKTPYSFDASIWEIFLPLAAGARLAVAEPDGHRDAAYLAAAVAEQGITVLQLVPSLLAAFLEGEGSGGACRALRRLFCGGEALPGELAGRFFARGGAALCNLYGPTEAAIDATFHPCAPGEAGGTVPIGRPIANSEVYLADTFHLVPWGGPGELHLGGAGLARGYAGRPDLTAERFLPHPWSGVPGARLYRTGDLARLRPDGELEFLGRTDRQVKVRGFRIEPGEIEAALSRHPAVREAAVAVRDEPSGQRRLVGYVVPAAVPAGGGDLHRLPDGLEVFCLNRNEADLIYQEIFVDETYLSHGVTLGDGACVFDVGANIGLFTLYLSGRFDGLRLLSFEPIPPTFAVLAANAARFQAAAELFPCALAARSGEAELTFYPHWSAMSGAYADQAEEEAVSRAALLQQDRRLEEHSDELLAARFAEKQVFTCRLRTLSEVIREAGIERIDLLKIDAEKSEEDVLAGLADEDWEKVAQLVIEVHDTGGRLDRVRALLAGRGYTVVTDRDAPLHGTAVWNLYAVHPARVRPAEGGRARPELRVHRPALQSDELGPFLAGQLPEHMVPAVFVPLERLPRLANGKLDRAALPDPASVLPRPEEEAVAPRTPTEKRIAAIWEEVLGLRANGRRVGAHDNFFRLGGDSIQSILAVSRAGREGLRMTARQLFENQTVAALAAVVDAQGGTALATDAGPVSGEVLLTPAQSAFFSRGLPYPQHFNQAILLAIEASVGERWDGAALRGAVEALLTHHDALRMRFELSTPERAKVRQVDDPPGAPAPCCEIDLAALPPGRRSAALESAAATTQGSLDLAAGPLLRVVLFRLGKGEADRLLLVVHHLVVDGVSWRILLEDLETAWRALAAGRAAELPPRTTSLQRWAERLAAQVRTTAVAAEGEEWLALLARAPAPLPVDHADGPNDVGSLASVTVALDPEETRALLRDVPRAYRTQINDVLLTALAEALSPWAGNRRLLLELEGHGREEIFPDLDVSHTVGWFTSAFPVLLDLTGTTGPGGALKAVKEQLRALPGNGLSYSLLRHLGEGAVAERLRAAPSPDIAFNYLGQLDQAVAAGRLFRSAPESAGPGRHPSQPRGALLEINAAVGDGRLQANWLYSTGRHRRATIERLAEAFAAELRRLIAHCQSADAGGFTPSDFPLAGLDQETLDRLAAAVPQIDDLYPATPTQQGLLFHTLESPGSGVYLGQLSLALGPELDAAAFASAWQQVVDRHAVLRTAFSGLERERPVQVVHARVRLPWQRHDWNDWEGLPAATRARRLDALLAEDRRRGFDLERPPLARATLIRLGAEGYRFVWTHHHAILDGWSMPILLRDLLAFYEVAAAGREARMEPPPPFRDYVAWLGEQDPATAEAVWRRVLAGVAAPTPLPEDREGAGHGIGLREETLSAAVSDALRALIREQELTLNTVLQGAWAILLHAASGEPDVVFGSVSAGRSAPVPGIEEMVGLFINTLPARVTVEERAPLATWLRGLQESQAETRQFEHIPLLQLQEWSEVPRGRPLFESILVFESYPVDRSVREKAGLGFRITDLASWEQTNYPLTLVAEPGSALHLRLSHDLQRISGPVAARLLRRLAALLAGMAAAPGATLADLPLLPEEERHQILAEWNDTARDLPGAGLTLPQWIARRAAESPRAPAVLFAGQTLSYGELDRRANQLAHHLRRSGVGPEVRVGLLVERSPEMMIALVGILKAGGAYVPLDPSYPEERLAFMAGDAGLAVLLTAGGLGVPATVAAARVLRLDTDWPAIAAESDAEPRPSATSDHPAYVIYTSGSTGRPKGAVNTHRAVVNRLLWMQEAYGLTPGDRVLQKTPLSFDVSVWELFWPLLTGVALVLAFPGGHRDTAYLARLIEEEEVTTAHFVPSLLQVFLEGLEPGRCPSLRRVIASGEALPAELQTRFFARLPGAGLHNLYGPTEAAVDVTAHACRPDDPGPGVPIGRPIANLSIRLLDAGLRPVPIGVPGELYIGGAGLARGYLARPDLTAERFVPDLWSGRPGERLYRTGDLAVWRDDGEIRYIGRTDHQVKVRGVRIEPGEIETVLGSHPAVRAAAVLARHGEGGPLEDTRLAACVVASGSTGQDELRAFLRARLPEAMVPDLWIFLDALPLLPNGKVDRKALAGLARSEAMSERVAWAGERLAPRTVLELELAGLWEELLGGGPVGVRDSFFALGGHSLLALRLMARLRQRFGRELPLSALLEHPTVEHLARRLETEGEAASWSPLVDLQPRGTRSPLFVVHAVGGEVLSFYHLARHLGPDQPFFGLQAAPPDEQGEVPHPSIEAMAANYLTHLRTVRPHGPYFLGGWSLGGAVAFEMAQMLLREGEEVALLALLDTLVPLRDPEPARLDEGALLLEIAGREAAEKGAVWTLEEAELRDLPFEEQLRRVLDEMHRLHVLAPEIDIPLLRRLLAGHQARVTAFERYVPAFYPGRLDLFRPQNIDRALLERASPERRRLLEDTYLGWGDLAARIEVHSVPGNHETMLAEPHVREFATILRHRLGRG